MLTWSKGLAAAAALSLAGAPAMAAPTGLSGATAARASSATDKESDLNGESGGTYIAIAGVIAVIVAIVLISSDDDDKPNSP